MCAEYYGASPLARDSVNRLLRLTVTGDEQDWELEMADPRRIEEMLRLLREHALDLEERSALALLLFASIEAAETEKALDDQQIESLASYFSSDREVRDRMHFFWIRQRLSHCPAVMGKILGID